MEIKPKMAETLVETVNRQANDLVEDVADEDRVLSSRQRWEGFFFFPSKTRGKRTGQNRLIMRNRCGEEGTNHMTSHVT